MTIEKKYQAIAPETQHFKQEAFTSIEHTEIRWLGNSSHLINSRGTCIMVDPLLKGFDMPLLRETPILPEEVPHLDAILITHDDNDHLSKPTIEILKDVTDEFHAPHFVSSILESEGCKSFWHSIGDEFEIKNVSVKLTPADHAWKNGIVKYNRTYAFEDYCGFWIDTPDGSIWVIGDSRLLPEQLNMPQADVIFFDFSDSSWHIGFDNAVKLANTYPKSELLCCHWGTVDAPDMTPFNGDPKNLMDKVVNPERIRVIAPGEVYRLIKNSHNFLR